jgi:tight adherence protein B
MFPEDVSQFAIIALAMLAAAGLAWVFLYPYLSGEAAAAQRLDRVAGGQSARHGSRVEKELELRKKSVEESIKELENRQGNNLEKNPPLEVRIEQAGLSWSKTTYYILSAFCGVVVFVLTVFFIGSALSALGSAALAAVSLPRAFLNNRRKTRLNKFINEFPNALDVITRGVKAGLPVTDCLRICAQESAEPIKSEFRQIIEAQALNIPIGTAVEMLYQRVPLPETNFFAIVITVQQKSGGNLSEILTNLSKVLRDRKKMRGKIRAMSQESIASAAIIGSLPIVVMLLLYFMNPEYISMLWLKPLGQLMLAGAFVWMGIGALVMRKMISFDF